MRRAASFLVVVLSLAVCANAAPTVISVDSLANPIASPLNTGIWVNSGDTLHIYTNPDDTWSLGEGVYRTCNSSGTPYCPIYTYGGLSTLYGTLVGQIDSNPFFVIGTDFTSTFTESGILKLMCWDSPYTDNSGAIDVQVEAPPVPLPGALLLGGIGTCAVSWLRKRRLA